MTDLILTGRRVGGRHHIVDVARDSNIHRPGAWILDLEQAIAVAAAWRDAPAADDVERQVDVVDDEHTILFVLRMEGETTTDRWEHVATRDGVGFSTAEMPLDVQVERALEWLTPGCLICGATGQLALTRAEAAALQRGAFVHEALPDVSRPLREQVIGGAHPACWTAAFGPA
jgi:hypothetical protein